MLTSLPRDILLEVLIRSELADIQKVCVLSRITLITQELDYISAEFGLPYIRRSQPGLSYLLRCSKLNKKELVIEFLANDDPRVLEVATIKEVACNLFPLHLDKRVVVHDCPQILLKLFEKEEWNAYVLNERSIKHDYPLTSCAVHNSIQMLEILLGSEMKFHGRRSLELALVNGSLEIVDILLSQEGFLSVARDWVSIIHFLVECSHPLEIFRLFLSKVEHIERFPWFHLLEYVVKKSKTKQFKLLCDCSRVVEFLGKYSILKTAVYQSSTKIAKIILKKYSSEEMCDKAFDLTVSLDNYELLDVFVSFPAATNLSE